MQRPAHVGSYYAASAHAAPARPVLEGTVECDVCVVGAGIAGCSSALHLAQAGLSVVVLEQLIELELLGKGGDEERRGARRLHHGARILLPDHVKRVRADHAPVSRNAN